METEKKNEPEAAAESNSPGKSDAVAESFDGLLNEAKAAVNAPPAPVRKVTKSHKKGKRSARSARVSSPAPAQPVDNPPEQLSEFPPMGLDRSIVKTFAKLPYLLVAKVTGSERFLLSEREAVVVADAMQPVLEKHLPEVAKENAPEIALAATMGTLFAEKAGVFDKPKPEEKVPDTETQEQVVATGASNPHGIQVRMIG